MRWTLSAKVTAVVAGLVSLFVAATVVSASAALQVREQIKSTLQEDAAERSRLAGLRYNLLQWRRAEKDISIDLAVRLDAVPTRTQLFQALDTKVRELAAGATARAAPGECDAAVALQADLLAYLDGVEPAVAAVAAGKLLEMALFETALDGLKKRARKAEDATAALVDVLCERTQSGEAQMQNALQAVLWTLGLASAVAVAATLAREATAQQRDGLRQVNQAVAMLAPSTQRNAALVAQSSAAADSLRAQAAGLLQTVGVFRTRAAWAA